MTNLFTQEQIDEIRYRLSIQSGSKDTQFDLADLPLKGNEQIAIVQDGVNKRVQVDEFFQSLNDFGLVDFFNVSHYYNRMTESYEEYRMTLEDAVNYCPPDVHRGGQVITFMGTDYEWHIWQYLGDTPENWTDIENYWVDLLVAKSVIEDSPLVSPVLSGRWTVGNASYTDKDIVAERGYTATWEGNFQWDREDGHKSPERTDGDFGDSLPASGLPSSALSQSFTDSGKIEQSLFADKIGMIVKGEKVVNATGEDETKDSVSVTFKDRLFYGLTDGVPTAAQIKNLTSELVSSRAKTIRNITAPKTKYFVYAYPKSLGDLTNIIQDGATPVLTAFNKYEVDYVAIPGNTVRLNVYVSANDGAFTNVQLQFI